MADDKELVERLRASPYMKALTNEAASAIERLSAIEQERDALRGALRPFAVMADMFPVPDWDDKASAFMVVDELTVGQLRACRAALNQSRTDAQEAPDGH